MIKNFKIFEQLREDDPYNEEDWGFEEKWKKGDVVICIMKGEFRTLTLNKEYVLNKDEFVEDEKIYVRVLNDGGYYTDYYKIRFRKK